MKGDASALKWSEGDVPIVGEYLELRNIAGMGKRSPQAAAKGLEHTLHVVTVRDGARLVGMGRVVGDGGTAVTITDIAVDPGWRRLGIATGILNRITDWCRAELPRTCFVSLIADPGAFALYHKAGFEMRTGMAMKLE
ncbi:GNAT family N-acetyltransferase [Palleronia caenipelagi]|uniref:GNAT family N-acetyltransferase n=1 Tax=Palleronia caenipelagi TaxID=2489174 RepID=A0A547Q5Q5_9RHOB|nr:GNAT family N-acetyltransferase [Palleronia caenipelagi]TRD21715.1 GNAT family N-acetyltransferase [Palleronia caenipelagi]